MNPSSTYWNISDQIQIFNDSFILFSNTSISFSAPLQSLNLTTVSSIIYNSVMNVNTIESLTIMFDGSGVSVSRVILTIPIFFQSLLSYSPNGQPISTSNTTLQHISLANSTTVYKLILPIFNTLSLTNLTITVLTNPYQLLLSNSIITI